MYHQITPDPPPGFRKYAVTPTAFASQMDWLARAGYTPVDLDALTAAREGRGGLPRRPVVITFDDGFRDTFDHAVPILLRRGFTAVFFLVAGLMGEIGQWLKSERGVELPLMDWAMARRLEELGFQCGSHTLQHPRLAKLSDAECRKELVDSRELLERRLGHAIQHLAYPFGSFDSRVRVLAAEAGYVSGCTVEIGISRATDDRLSLPRVPVNGQESLLDFLCRLKSGWSVNALVRGKARGGWRAARRLAGMAR